MQILLIVVHVIASLVLIAVILLQSGRGGGLNEAFGAGSTSTLFGTSAATFLQKATSVCAILFLITSLSMAVLSSRSSKSLMELNKIKKALPKAQKQVMPTEIPKEGVPVETEKAPSKK